MIYDYVILGGGIIGTAILNKLTRVGKKAVLIEKGNDIAIGTTKANTALVHAGFDAKPNTLKAKFNVEGALMMEEVCKQLSVPYKRNGAIVVGNNIKKINELFVRGEKNGVKKLELIDKEKLHKLVPNLNKDLKYGLLAKSAGIVSPYELAIAYAEESVLNGGKVVFNEEIKKAKFIRKYWNMFSEDKQYKAYYVINCTGANYNNVAKIFNAEQYDITYRIGEYFLLDSTEIGLINYTIFPLPTKQSKGVVITPTVDGNILIGPNATEIDDYNTDTSKYGLSEVKQKALEIFPDINFSKNIRNFAGTRTIVGDDFIIQKSKSSPNVINIAGICSPGLSSAPAIAKYVVENLLNINTQEKIMIKRKPITHIKNLSTKELNELIVKDCNYGEIICRCEQVSKGEIIEALQSPLHPKSVDGIKRRTRAGMGRCQGGFCLIDEINAIADELNIKLENVVKDNVYSNYIVDDINSGENK